MKIEILEFVNACEKITGSSLSFASDQFKAIPFIYVYDQCSIVAEISERDLSMILYKKYFPELLKYAQQNKSTGIRMYADDFAVTHELFVSFYKDIFEEVHEN